MSPQTLRLPARGRASRPAGAAGARREMEMNQTIESRRTGLKSGWAQAWRLGFLLLALAAGGAQAWSEADEARWHALNKELRCLVCQNQSIADSHAELAQDLRGQVREMMEAGRSDAEIRAYMTDRYGDFVLYRPPFKPLTLMLWLGPLLMLLLALGLIWHMRRRVAAPAQPGGRAQELEKLLDEVERD